jgi:hypothetical protein
LEAGETVDNGDGTYTFTQQVDETSTEPYYEGPWVDGDGRTYGFGYYSGRDHDFGWLHTFVPTHGKSSLLILSATLNVRAYDVDYNPEDIQNGEFDGVSVDGTWLNPQFLQGSNNAWTVTTFDVDPKALSDGELRVDVDIDMIRYGWLATIDYSRLEVHYTYTTNQAPYRPELTRSPVGDVTTDDALVVNIVGPVPADPDGHDVTYRYRWFVDAGTGFYVDDEFAERGNHTGSSVPAGDTEDGDRWLAEVIAVDGSGARSSKACIAFPIVGETTTAPVIESVWADPAVLWSPNHKMVEVTVFAIVSGATREATYAIVDVESSDPPDEDDELDWEITGDHTVLLRSERSGGAEGRVYTVTVVATNASGSTTTAEVLVPVAHDQSGK